MSPDAGADFTSGYQCNGDADADQPSATAPSLSGVWRLPVPVALASTRVPPAPAPQPLRACASRQDSQLRQARTDLLREGGALPHVSINYMFGLEGLFLNVVDYSESSGTLSTHPQLNKVESRRRVMTVWIDLLHYPQVDVCPITVSITVHLL